MPKNDQQFRITFYPSAEVRMNPLEFAWLLSKCGLEVVGKGDSKPALFVRAESVDNVLRLVSSVNKLYGALIFEEIEVLGGYGYEGIEGGGQDA